MLGLGLPGGRFLVPVDDMAVAVGLRRGEGHRLLLRQGSGQDVERVELAGLDAALRGVGPELHAGNIVGDLVAVVVLLRGGQLLLDHGRGPPRLGLGGNRDDRLILGQGDHEIGGGGGVGLGRHPEGQHRRTPLGGVGRADLDMGQRRCGGQERHRRGDRRSEGGAGGLVHDLFLSAGETATPRDPRRPRPIGRRSISRLRALDSSAESREISAELPQGGYGGVRTYCGTG